jgi:hypothetical protein
MIRKATGMLAIKYASSTTVMTTSLSLQRQRRVIEVGR